MLGDVSGQVLIANSADLNDLGPRGLSRYKRGDDQILAIRQFRPAGDIDQPMLTEVLRRLAIRRRPRGFNSHSRTPRVRAALPRARFVFLRTTLPLLRAVSRERPPRRRRVDPRELWRGLYRSPI